MLDITKKLTGVHSALVTPFTQNGELDVRAFSELVMLQKRDGVHGVVVCGTTGEAPTLTMSERQELVRTAKELCGSLPVTAGAGSNCTKTAIELQKAMEDAGADATLQVVPYYNKPTQRGIYEHYSAIAKSARVPIIMYNIPGRTNIDMTPETTAALAKEYEVIVGTKDANTNMERLSDLMLLTKGDRPQFLVLGSEESAFLPLLALGGDGIISGVAQIATVEMLALYRGVTSGDMLYAQKISRKLNGFIKLMFSHTNPIPIKTVLARLGIIENHYRLPLCPLTTEEENHLIKKCQVFDFIKTFKERGFCS